MDFVGRSMNLEFSLADGNPYVTTRIREVRETPPVGGAIPDHETNTC